MTSGCFVVLFLYHYIDLVEGDSMDGKTGSSVTTRKARKERRSLMAAVRQENFLKANRIADRNHYVREVDPEPIDDVSDVMLCMRLEDNIHSGRMIGATHNLC